MMAAALIGAHFGDLQGASIAVALQRLGSGLVDFSFAVRTLGGRAGDIVLFACRSFIPFWLAAGVLVFLHLTQPLSGTSVQVGLNSAIRTLAAIASFAAIAYAVDRQVMKEVSALLRRLLFPRQAAI
jgi:hypothetical protein